MAAIIASITMITISTKFTKSSPLGGLLMANSICKHNAINISNIEMVMLWLKNKKLKRLGYF
jgi:hypothetical protein